MSATLNAGSFRSDDTLYGASRTLKSYLRSILMHKHGIRLIPKSALGLGCAKTPAPAAHVETSQRNCAPIVLRARFDTLLENCIFYISLLYEFSLRLGQYQSFGDVRLNVRFARKRTRLGDLWARRYRVEAEGLGLPFWPIAGLGQNEEPGGFGGEARRRRRLEQRTEMTTTRTHFTFRVAMLPPRPPKPPPPRPPKPPPPPPAA